MLFALLILHALIAVAAPVVACRLHVRVFYFCALAPAATLAWISSDLGPVAGGEPIVETVTWVPALGLGLDLRLDAFALLMVFLISGIGLLIFVYARFYFSERPGLGRFAGTLTAFAGSMLGIVLTDNLLAIYLFWELTSITSYLLIGFEDGKAAARSAALQAILTTGAGGLAMLGGFVLLGQAAGTYSLSAILSNPPASAAAGAGLVLVLIGAFTKSAQVPFHTWLPAAMAAPTPVSAYLHSATMVKAGVYLVARLSPAFAAVYPFWRPAVIGVGLVTMLVGGLRALRQHDLKLVLAYGTVSQLGFLMVLVGVGEPALTFAGSAMILAHALFKATLFLVVGIIDHQAHSRDLRVLNGIGRRFPVLFGIAAIATASMAGLPPLLGFVAKEAALEALLHDGGIAATAGIVLGSVLTFAYGARFLWGAFADKANPVRPITEIKAPARGFVLPAAILAAATIGLGLVPAIAEPLVAGGAGALDDAAGGGHLYLWHGFSPALALSVLTAVGGLLAFRYRLAVERAQTKWQLRLSAQNGYEFLLKGLNRAADRVTGFVQNGSLPVYIAVILATAVVLPTTALLRTPSPGMAGVVFAESPLQAAVSAAVLVAAVFLARARQRFVTVMLLGAVGFGVAVLFLIQGAPDLALTQLLIETLALVIFVLVLRHLPLHFERIRWPIAKALRIAVSGAVGLFVAGFAWVASSSGGAGHISEEFLARSLPEGGGRNVVNVILTDFRGLDTLGEITVLAVAAFGIASLVLASRGEEDEPDEV